MKSDRKFIPVIVEIMVRIIALCCIDIYHMSN